MTREEVDFWPILHAIPLIGLDAGAQFFTDGVEGGRYGLRGIVPNTFDGNARLSNVPRGLPAWKAFAIEQVFCLSNVALSGNVTLRVHAGRAIAEIPPWGACAMPRPFQLGSEHLIIEHTLEEQVKRSGVPLQLEACAVGKLAAFFAKLAEETYAKNPDWHQDRNRCGRDHVINDALSLLHGLHDVAATTPLVVFGFAGQATIELL